MGWLGARLKQFVSTVAGAPPVELTYISSVPSEDVPGLTGEIKADECYVELYLESLRLEQARRLATKFNGVVYSFVTLSREADNRAQLSAISKPEKLTELDENSVDRVITVSKQMMGATPYRGGAISFELGLFSVKSGNLLSPVLNYVTKVSQAAGISYVGAIKPFLPLITEGMDLLTAQTKDTVLEVGVDTDFSPTIGTVMAIIARPPAEIDAFRLLLAKDGRLMHKGEALKCGYATFSLRSVTQKADYGEIPELKERIAAIQAAIRSNSEKDARAAYTAFRLACITSPDLIPADSKSLIAKVKAKLDNAFDPTASIGTANDEADSLSDLKLYD
jgi:hypothetical protein